MSQSFVRSSLIEVSIINSLNGKPLPIFSKDNRYYVVAKDGLEYTIQVKTSGMRRLEVLASVDNRNTLKNEVADLLTSNGLIVSQYQTYNIPGWGMHNTTPFIMKAYDRETIAVQATGSNKNLGVIAVAAFQEYERPVGFNNFRGDMVAKGGNLESMSYGSRTRGAGMGTGTDESRVTGRKLGTTNFRRQEPSTPDGGLVEIYAMPEWWLTEQGILPETPVHDKNHPAGFSNSNTKPDYWG